MLTNYKYTNKMIKKWMTKSKKIIGILKNYELHAKEMKGEVPKVPLYFLKPTSSFVYNENGDKYIEIPSGMKEIHHEVELGVIISKSGRDIPKEKALEYVAGYCLMLDMTSRTLQQEAKEKGLPWAQAKGYDTFAPVSEFIPKEKVSDPQNLELWLKVNGQLRQKANTKDMVYKVDRLIEEMSNIMTFEEGDFISTGTPEGVGPVKDGDIIEAGISGYSESNIKFLVKNRVYSKI